MITAAAKAVRAGAAGYNRLTLRFYDSLVLGLVCRHAWGCPSATVLAHFQAHVGGRHLDIGVGTGYFLDHCRFPVAQPLLALADLNAACLAVTAARLRRYHPIPHRLNVLEPFDLPEGPFDSISMNYLLHCLPGTMADKAQAFGHAAAQLRPEGVFFGSTVLGQGVAHNAAGRLMMAVCNRLGTLSNRDDDEAGLREGLARHFTRVDVRVLGAVALFVARP